jgi:hypothetical protein
MPSISIPAAVLGAGALGAGASVASGIVGGTAAEKAAGMQASAADYVANLQLQQFQQTQKNLAPFIQGGTGAFSQLLGLTGAGPGGNPLTAPLTKPFQPTMDQLAQTPGYQFTLGQGELATQNQFAAQGLGGVIGGNQGTVGPSGALGKGLANYAEGLAQNTYQSQFQNYLQQNQQIYSMLGGQGTIGENAAAMQGTQGLTATGQAGSALTAGAAAGAAGTVGAANAISNSLSGVAGAGSNTALLLALNQGGLFGNNTASSYGGTPT